MGNLVEHLMELAADWNAAFIRADLDESQTHRATTEVFFEWPNGEIIETEIYSWHGGHIFSHSKFLPDAPKGHQFKAGYLSVEGAVRGWLEPQDLVVNFKNQQFIWDMCRDSYLASQWKGLKYSISYFSQMIDDDPALMELLSDE